VAVAVGVAVRLVCCGRRGFTQSQLDGRDESSFHFDFSKGRQLCGRARRVQRTANARGSFAPNASCGVLRGLPVARDFLSCASNGGLDSARVAHGKTPHLRRIRRGWRLSEGASSRATFSIIWLLPARVNRENSANFRVSLAFLLKVYSSTLRSRAAPGARNLRPDAWINPPNLP